MYLDKKLNRVDRFSFNIKQLSNLKLCISNVHEFPYLLLVILLTILTTLPKAVSHGLGGDGQFYAVVARNMSEGLGSFWKPHFSETVATTFYDHPPLGLGIQSLFFSLFGDSYLIEKLFSVATLLLVQFFMVLIWFNLFKENERVKSLFWLPLLLFILIPTVTYSIGNNLLENTMAVFTIIAMYSLLRSMNKKINYSWIIFAALMLVAATLTKGPAGLFLLIFFPVYWFTTNSISFRCSLQLTFILLLSFTFIFSLILINDGAQSNLTHYLNGQLMASIKDGRGKAEASHFYILGALLKDLLPLLIIVTVMFLIRFKIISRSGDKKIIRYSIFMFMIALSASIPSMISLKQNITYIVASFPYFAIGFSIILISMFENKNNDISGKRVFEKLVSYFSIIGITLTLIYSFNNTGNVIKQQNYYYDAKIFSKLIKNEKILGVCNKPKFPWDIHSFFARYYRVSLDYTAPFKHKYFIGTETCVPKNNIKYKVMNSEYMYLKLYEIL